MVRVAQIKDLDVLVSLFIAENEHNSDLAPDVVRKTEDVLNETELQDILSDENQLLIVSEHDGKVVGALLGNLTDVKERRWTQSRTYGYIEELIVSSEARKLGVATGLVSYFSSGLVLLALVQLTCMFGQITQELSVFILAPDSNQNRTCSPKSYAANKAFKADSQRLAFSVCFEFSVYSTMV
ncbi:GNAT family N-acetyltransferase [Vibrio harveyi]|uniref:GNAT family N-acetyltransferase n=1 Tax=Vibrio harveyi TaxID=669 RepID=UPI0038CD9451